MARYSQEKVATPKERGRSEKRPDYLTVESGNATHLATASNIFDNGQYELTPNRRTNDRAQLDYHVRNATEPSNA